MKGKIALVVVTLIATLISSPQAFSSNKTSIVIKKAGRSATSIPNTILSGNGIPAKTTGIDGDFYIDIKNANLYGPKTKGVWKLATSLRIPALPAIDGAVGTKGNTGEQGATGAAGTNGAAGSIGLTGTNGVNGAPGAPGAIGATGITGATGSNGLKGDTGNVGATGARGEAGIAGTKGDIGATGNTGSSGAKGDTGLAGSNGADGTNGTNGAVGAAGTNGLKGDTGNTGANGVKGDTGATGPDGIQGIQGVQGIGGNTGVDGTNGSQGIQGIQGIQGDAGIDGGQGIQGSGGNPGVDGTNGSQGIQGIQGIKGDAGISITYWASITMFSFATDIEGNIQDSGIFFRMQQNSNYSFEILMNGLLPLTSTEDYKINATIVCSVGCSSLQQYVVLSDSINNANNMNNRQFGIRILGVIANGAETPDLRIRLSIRTATTNTSAVMFSGKALINKVGSIG